MSRRTEITENSEPSGRRALTSIAGRAITSWGHTGRLITIAVALTGLVVAGIWLLKVNVTIGPVSITGR